VSAALKAQSAASHPPAPTARVANPLSFIPAVSVAAPMPGPQAPPPAELVPSRPQPIPATRPAALVTPIASTAVPQPKATAPVRDPAPVQEPVPAVARPPLTPQPVTVAPATVSVVVAPTAQHSTAARMALQPAPVAAPNTVTQVLVPRGELGTIRGVTIVDNRGALASTDAAPVVSESLGDAARRLRKAKQQQAARP
jgi:hypothetical protein